jgi:maleylacetate reductase
MHAVLLPQTAAHHAAGHPEAVARIARALGVGEGAGGLWDVGRAVGAPRDLASVGLRPAQADEAAALVAESGVAGREEVRRLLGRALRGERPQGPEEGERE